MKRSFVLLLPCLLAVNLLWAGVNDTAVFETLNLQRIRTNMTGMKVLAGWGLANAAEGIAGSFIAGDNEWKHFQQMNAAWGLINAGIAGMGFMGARREMTTSYSESEALHRYEANKRLYLINAGLDGLYISTGIILNQHSRRVTSDAGLYSGFGKSLVMQGAGLLLFDVSMFCAHQRRDKDWYRLLSGLAVSGNGIGFRYVLR